MSCLVVAIVVLIVIVVVVGVDDGEAPGFFAGEHHHRNALTSREKSSILCKRTDSPTQVHRKVREMDLEVGILGLDLVQYAFQGDEGTRTAGHGQAVKKHRGLGV